MASLELQKAEMYRVCLIIVSGHAAHVKQVRISISSKCAPYLIPALLFHRHFIVIMLILHLQEDPDMYTVK